MNEIEKVNLSALLHDIGKFYQRAQPAEIKGFEKEKYPEDECGRNGAHGRWSAAFVREYYDDIEMEDYVLHHHKHTKSKNKDICSMITKADQHSSKERIKEEKKDPLKSLLISIFSEINIKDNENTDLYYTPLTELSISEKSFEKLMPQRENKMEYHSDLKRPYKILWGKFKKEFEAIPNKNDFTTVLSLLRKYTSTMPSAAYVSKSDISLYDHLKTTAALSTCRYLFKKDSSTRLTQKDELNVYLTINGDISGIQNFIYKISSPAEAQSGMNRRLRGRSLFLTLLNESIAKLIVDKLGLTQANIIFCGGGKFTIIAPNTEKAIHSLDRIKNSINKYFIDKFNAELYLSLVWHETNGDDFNEFRDVLNSLNKKIRDDKEHKFLGNLEDIFKLEDEVKGKYSCPVCGNIGEHEGVCMECESHEELGGAVANSRYMVQCITDTNHPDFSIYFEEMGIGYIFTNSLNQLEKYSDEFKHLTVSKLNNTDFLDSDINRDNVSFSFSFLANNIPKHSKYPLYFEHLSKIAKGANKLGVLKMDVDDLGLIFSEGLSEDVSISRISTLSSQLDLFFSGFINIIAKDFKVYEDGNEESAISLELQDEDKTPFNVYRDGEGEVSTIHINYAGGDDLLVLGPYDDIIEFAGKINEKFKKWTCYNLSINLSGGISIVGSKFPVGKAAILADEHLEVSKSCGKNKITLFNSITSLEENENNSYYALMDFGKDLERYCSEGKISKGFVYTMLQLAEDSYADIDRYKTLPNSEEELNKLNLRKIRCKSFVPRLFYKSRTIKEEKLSEKINKKAIKFMPWINVPVSWTSLRMR